MNKTSATFPSLLALVLLLGGCGAVEGLGNNLRLPLLSGDGRKLDQAAAFREYPTEAKAGKPLDIEVIRSDRGIVIENRTVHAFQSVDLWLNQEYGATVDQLEVGRNGRIALSSFINRYGETYPTAKFLQPENDRPLVLAELVIDGKVHKLPVRLVDDWRRP